MLCYQLNLLHLISEKNSLYETKNKLWYLTQFLLNGDKINCVFYQLKHDLEDKLKLNSAYLKVKSEENLCNNTINIYI